jgi:uncharacterized protein
VLWVLFTEINYKKRKMKARLIVAALLCVATSATVAQTQESNNSKTNTMTAKEVVEAYSIALSKGDVKTAFSYFNPQAKWHQPGNNKFSGTKSGLDAIGKMLSDMMGATQGTLPCSF